MKLLLALVLMASSVAFANSTVTSPMAYAEESTLGSAENSSDMEPYGLYECHYTNDDANQPQIECVGYRTVLVFGGQEHTGEFICNFSFKKINETNYEVTSESCE